MYLTFIQTAGIIAVAALIIGAGIISGKKVSGGKDFTSGGKAGSVMVAGGIMGTLVSGQSTVGTAQMAFNYGICAMWWSLGCCVGCLLLCFFYGTAIRRSGEPTLTAILSKEYGNAADVLASVLSSLGTFISMLSQMIAFCALLTCLFPISTVAAAIISACIMGVYVIFGGICGTGAGGTVKLFFLYVCSITAGITVLCMCRGIGGLNSGLQSLLLATPLGADKGIDSVKAFNHRYWSLFARGPFKDTGSGLSLVLGVLSTQTYSSMILSGKTDSTARKGALLSAFLTPPIGAACILIGLFMRSKCITTQEIASLVQAGQAVPENLIELTSTAQVFPMFALHFLPQLPAGIVLGTILMTIVGGGAGLSLGAATVIANDIFCKVNPELKQPEKHIVLVRIIIAVILALAAFIAVKVPGAIINDFGYLSMGLRGTSIFLPLTLALFFPGIIRKEFIIASIAAGPVTVLIFGLLNILPFDALFAGIAVQLIIAAAGLIFSRIQKTKA